MPREFLLSYNCQIQDYSNLSEWESQLYCLLVFDYNNFQHYSKFDLVSFIKDVTCPTFSSSPTPSTLKSFAVIRLPALVTSNDK